MSCYVVSVSMMFKSKSTKLDCSDKLGQGNNHWSQREVNCYRTVITWKMHIRIWHEILHFFISIFSYFTPIFSFFRSSSHLIFLFCYLSSPLLPLLIVLFFFSSMLLYSFSCFISLSFLLDTSHFVSSSCFPFYPCPLCSSSPSPLLPLPTYLLFNCLCIFSLSFTVVSKLFPEERGHQEDIGVDEREHY